MSTSVITVRLSKELHDRLQSEARKRIISMNKLCVELLGTCCSPVSLPAAGDQPAVSADHVEE